MLGPAFQITFQGEDSLKTKVGAALSLMFVASLIVSTIVFVNDYTDTSKPTISSTELALDRQYQFNIAENNMMPIFFIQDYAITDRLEAQKALTKFSFLIVSTHMINDENNELTNMDTIRKGVPCSTLAKEGYYDYPAQASNYLAIKENVDKHGICFGIQDPSIMFISGTGNNVGDKKVTIRVGPCFGRSDCETVNYFNYEVRVVFPQFSTLLYNSDKPYDVKINIDDYTQLFAWKSYTTHTIKAQLRSVNQAPRMLGVDSEIARYPHVVEIRDHYFSRYTNQYGLIIKNCTNQGEMHLESCQGFLKYVYRFSPVLTRYTRSYSRITDLLSEIGGISSILFQAFTYLNMVYIFFAKKRIMIERVFPLLSFFDKNRGPEYISNIEKAANELFENSFDVANIFQELCCIRLISKVLLDGDQQKAASLYPLYELYLDHTKTKEEKEQAKKSKQKPAKPLSPQKQTLEKFKDLFTRLKLQESKTPLINTSISSQMKPLRGSIAIVRSQADKVLLKSIEGLGVHVPSKVVPPELEISNIEEDIAEPGMQDIGSKEIGLEGRHFQQRNDVLKDSSMPGDIEEFGEQGAFHAANPVPASQPQLTKL